MLALFVCPAERTPLVEAEAELLDRLNRAIADPATKVVNVGGRTISEPITAGLVRQDGKLLYPIVDDIPVLLVDEAISLEQIP